MRLRSAVVLCCIGSVLAPAAAEAAGSVTANTSGTEVSITFQAGAGVANDVTVTTAPGSVVVSDTADTITVTTGSQFVCSGGGSNTVTCTSPNIRRATARLEDLGDRLHGSGSLSLTVSGDAGDDDLTVLTASASDPAVRAAAVGNDGNDRITTGDGNDNAEGGAGTDIISTGNGDDSGSGQEGDGDQVDLGPGDDRSGIDAGDGAGDVHVGGPGVDSLSMGPSSFPPPPIDIVLDLAAGTVGGTNVGAGTVSGFEDADLFGHATTRITGTAGQNVIGTREGADVVDPGAGGDFLDLSAGNDSAMVRDGYSDLVRCGPGDDSAEVDQLDVTTDCETVDLASVTPAGVATRPPDCRLGSSFKTRIRRRALLKRGVRVPVSCGTTASLSVRLLGQAKRRGKGIRIARAGDLVVAERSMPLAAGTRKVLLRVPKRLRSAIPRSARLRLVVEARDEFGNLKRLAKRVRAR